MGILLTTTSKQTPPDDPFKNGSFSKPVIQDRPDLAKVMDMGDIPFPAYLCTVFIDRKLVGLFQSISDIHVERNVEKLAQGGENEHSIELPGEISYGHVTLKSGYSTSNLFLDWMLAGQFDGDPFYKDVEIIHGRPSPKLGKVEMKRQWTFSRAFPVKWNITDFSLDDADKIIFESIELSYSYFTVVDL